VLRTGRGHVGNRWTTFWKPNECYFTKKDVRTEMIFSNYKIGAPKLYPPNAGYNLEPFCLRVNCTKPKFLVDLGHLLQKSHLVFPWPFLSEGQTQASNRTPKRISIMLFICLAPFRVDFCWCVHVWSCLPRPQNRNFSCPFFCGPPVWGTYQLQMPKFWKSDFFFIPSPSLCINGEISQQRWGKMFSHNPVFMF
jgi:hypothetical protein